MARPYIWRLITFNRLTVVQTLDHILHWSLWRRWHQAIAKACHTQRHRTALKKVRL